ncbi:MULTISPECIES: MFS transporter [Hungatella]|uniref:MFS transporter n=1 Tax=Hungatella hathewayi TaxID=154046 RepID=A0AAW9WAF3_9FIRM|nr:MULTISPECIES: glycoside-pentoside-hexuronide (GPH):cation symporter [Hungatella]MCQ4831478.1 glycoside-pentoside-hexuronide (GPH):cation symporter [Hungatella sp. SL.1.14]MUB62225.1 MFS transporter [Hungatella hathewayi]CUP24239.1 sugar (glycoside-Pentoside-Hexuronide) transporter [Hungatella hathewayi]
MGKQGAQQTGFGMRDKIGYLFGDFGNDFTFVLSSAFLLKFYTDVMGVSGYIVGIMMMIARLLDAVTDITMGQLVDRSPVRRDGKFRPWIRRMSGPVAFSSLLMYASWFQNMGMAFKVVWMFVTYLLWCSICYTGIVIPYGSLASAITSDPVERTQLSNFRSVGGTLAMTVSSVVLPLAVYYTDEAGHRALSGAKMTTAALFCSVGALICYILCYSLTTERVKLGQTTEKFDAGKLLRSLAHNRCLPGIVLVVLIREVANTGLQGMASYIYPNYFANTVAQSQSGVVGTVITLIMAAFIVKLAVRFGKKEITAAGCFLASGILAVAYFVHTENVYVWIFFYAVATVGLAVFGLIGWAMVSDIIDDTEVRTGERGDGTIYGIYSFARKAGQACSSGVTGILLSLIGYTPDTAFDAVVTDRIYDITCLAPMIGFFAMALAVIFLYPLDKKTVLGNAVKLEAERGK